MSAAALALPDPAGSSDIPIAPSAEVRHAMTPPQQEAFLEEAMAALNREALLIPQGMKHLRSTTAIWSVLGQPFE